MKTNLNPVLCYCNSNKSTDNIGIVIDNTVYLVDKYGKISTEQPQNIDITSINHINCQPVTTESELKVGSTYSISNTDMKLGKLTDIHLFGYSFLCFTPEKEIILTDMDYDEVVHHIQQGEVVSYTKKL